MWPFKRTDPDKPLFSTAPYPHPGFIANVHMFGTTPDGWFGVRHFEHVIPAYPTDDHRLKAIYAPTTAQTILRAHLVTNFTVGAKHFPNHEFPIALVFGDTFTFLFKFDL